MKKMKNHEEIAQLCRLCLVTDQVNKPIFEEASNITQILLKIQSCLPVTISQDDNLPKSICDGCFDKLDLLYQFWTTSANSEKQLISWLSEAGIEPKLPPKRSKMATKTEADQFPIKQEFQEEVDDGQITNEYILQQQKLPYKNEFSEKSEDEPPPKRARRAAAQVKVIMDEDSDDDYSPPVTKNEDNSEDDSDRLENDDDDSADFPDEPSTSADQPGPSGVTKAVAEAPRSINDVETIRIEIVSENNYKPNTRDNDGYQKKVCPKCNKKCRNLYFHNKREHANDTDDCQLCKRSFATEAEMAQHLEQHGENDIPCPEGCPSKFINHRDATLHSIFHLQDKFICSACPYSHSKRCNMTKHVIKHLSCVTPDLVQCVCDVCGKTMKTKESLKMHMKLHDTKGRRFKCKICNTSFQVKHYLQAHQRKFHSKEVYGVEGGFICELCGKEFSSNALLKNHMQRQHADKIVCDICGKELTQKSLKSHMENVHKYEENACHQCGSFFTDKYLYAYHLKVHQEDSE